MKQTRLTLYISAMAILGFILFWLTVQPETLRLKQGMAHENPSVTTLVPVPPDAPVVNKVDHMTLIEFFAGF